MGEQLLDGWKGWVANILFAVIVLGSVGWQVYLTEQAKKELRQTQEQLMAAHREATVVEAHLEHELPTGRCGLVYTITKGGLMWRDRVALIPEMCRP